MKLQVVPACTSRKNRTEKDLLPSALTEMIERSPGYKFVWDFVLNDVNSNSIRMYRVAFLVLVIWFLSLGRA